jgi:hypothetical protein
MTEQYKGLCGWVDDPAEVERVLGMLPMPTIVSAAQGIRGAGRGKAALLHLLVLKALGFFPNYTAQAIGDCVSHGWRTVTDVLKCVQIIAGQRAEWLAETATEPIYAGSRVEIGRGKVRGDGSVGAWAARWVSEYGILSRIKYGSLDLSEYSGERAKAWGKSGCPDELEPVAKEHPVKTVSLVTSYEQACDLLANGYPIAVCSDQGFASKRDAEGFARAQGSWGHCMAFIAADDEYKRPGLLCLNSWGPDWISGPTRHDQPAGSFWVDADIADKMLKAEDSFAASDFEGYPPRELDYMLI